MANEEHLAILKQGVEVWNKWREDNPSTIPDLNKSDITGAKLDGAILSGADLGRANLNWADLSGANLSKANLIYANLREANLNGVNLSEAKLIYANLKEADLRWADLRWANLIEAHLSGARICEAELGRAVLYKADLSRTDLRGVNLSEADLNQADLSGAILIWAILRETDLGDANLEVARLGNTIFADVDLSTVRGLETVYHQGPSTVGIDTLYKSQGKIPEVFLRGCGVPEEFIQSMPYFITGKAIHFYSCFISYSTKDQEFAERLHADLQDRGVRCWFAPEDIKGGKKLHEQIPEAIRLYDKLLLVLSENSMQSEWVKTEIYHARQDEIRENRRKLFPISLVEFGNIKAWQAFDVDTGKDMGREVREYFIPDFSNWKDHNAYKKAFDRLMRDLNLEGEEN